MKLFKLLNLSLCFFALVATVCACSERFGHLIALPQNQQNGMTISDTRTANDTIEAKTQNARVKLNGWYDSERVSHYYDLEIENVGKTPLKFDFSKIKLDATDARKVETVENYVETIKPKETKKYSFHLNVFKKESMPIKEGDLVTFAIPKSTLNENNDEWLEFKFKCVSDSNLKFIPHDPPRGRPDQKDEELTRSAK